MRQVVRSSQLTGCASQSKGWSRVRPMTGRRSSASVAPGTSCSVLLAAPGPEPAGTSRPLQTATCRGGTGAEDEGFQSGSPVEIPKGPWTPKALLPPPSPRVWELSPAPESFQEGSNRMHACPWHPLQGEALTQQRPRRPAGPGIELQRWMHAWRDSNAAGTEGSCYKPLWSMACWAGAQHGGVQRVPLFT